MSYLGNYKAILKKTKTWRRINLKVVKDSRIIREIETSVDIPVYSCYIEVGGEKIPLFEFYFRNEDNKIILDNSKSNEVVVNLLFYFDFSRLNASSNWLTSALSKNTNSDIIKFIHRFSPKLFYELTQHILFSKFDYINYTDDVNFILQLKYLKLRNGFLLLSAIFLDEYGEEEIKFTAKDIGLNNWIKRSNRELNYQFSIDELLSLTREWNILIGKFFNAFKSKIIKDLENFLGGLIMNFLIE